MIAGYIRSGAYSVATMEERELGIRKQAEDLIQSSLPLHKRILYNWVLYHARKGTAVIYWLRLLGVVRSQASGESTICSH